VCDIAERSRRHPVTKLTLSGTSSVIQYLNATLRAINNLDFIFSCVCEFQPSGPSKFFRMSLIFKAEKWPV